MSASIHYQPVKPTNGTRLEVGSGSWFIKTIEEAFDRQLPTVLSIEDVPALKGMAALAREHHNNPWQELIKSIEKYGAVEIWAEY